MWLCAKKYLYIKLEFRIKDAHLQISVPVSSGYLSCYYLCAEGCCWLPFSLPWAGCEISLPAPKQGWQTWLETQLRQSSFPALMAGCHMGRNTSVAHVERGWIIPSIASNQSIKVSTHRVLFKSLWSKKPQTCYKALIMLIIGSSTL